MRRQEDETFHHMAMRAALFHIPFLRTNAPSVDETDGAFLHHYGYTMYGDEPPVQFHQSLYLKGRERGGGEFRPVFDLRVGERLAPLQLPEPVPDIGGGFREFGNLRKLPGDLARSLLDLLQVFAEAHFRAFGYTF